MLFHIGRWQDTVIMSPQAESPIITNGLSLFRHSQFLSHHHCTKPPTHPKSQMLTNLRVVQSPVSRVRGCDRSGVHMCTKSTPRLDNERRSRSSARCSAAEEKRSSPQKCAKTICTFQTTKMGAIPCRTTLSKFQVNTNINS